MPKWIQDAVKIAAISLCLFIFLEGISSLALLTYHAVRLREKTVGPDAIIQYDPQLGVLYKPGLNLPDFFAPGVGFQTNSQSMREAEDIPAAVPAGKTRMLCVGDSFTVGEGVSGDQTWCSLLSEIDPELETVNLGHGGYGVDQMYLRYKLQGLPLKHDVLIFAFIAGDFYRMDADLLPNARKPFLDLEEGQLIVRNTPVPPFEVESGWKFFDPAVLQDLRVLELLRLWIRPAVKVETESGSEESSSGMPQILTVALAVFEDLVRTGREQGVTPIFVYLPTAEDYAFDPFRPIRDFLQRELSARGYTYVDLTEEMQKIPGDQAERFFLTREDVPNAPFARKHYSAAGHRFVASKLYDFLIEWHQRARAAV